MVLLNTVIAVGMLDKGALLEAVGSAFGPCAVLKSLSSSMRSGGSSVAAWDM